MKKLLLSLERSRTKLVLIEVENLTKTYVNGGVETPALRGVSFGVSKGEFLAIMGPSGSGKSTLLHVLGFLDKHTSGKYLFQGKGWDDFSETELANIRNKKMGFVFQTFNLLGRLTVLDNVKLPLMYSDIAPAKWNSLATSAIEAVGMGYRADYPANRLSGGEKQRAAIARALVNNPEIVFADEPTGNLDSESGKVVMEILQKLNDEADHTIILITHEQYTAETAKRIIKFHDGQILHDDVVKKRRNARNHFIK